MPKVGSRRFDYTPEGQRKAKAYAKKTGKRMTTQTPPRRKR